MPFDSENRRISRSINKQIQQSSSIKQQNLNDSRTQKKYENVKPNHAAFKGFIKIMEDDWELMQIAENFDPPLGDPWMGAQFRNWSVELNRFDERLIPFIYAQPLIRVAGNATDDGVSIRVPYKSIYIRVEDIAGENFIKKTTIHVTLYFTEPNVLMPYEAKLLIGYSNPQINV